MATYSLSFFQCDRCGYKEELNDPEMMKDWSFVHVYSYSEPIHISSKKIYDPVKRMDLCKDCTQQFGEWRKGNNG